MIRVVRCSHDNGTVSVCRRLLVTKYILYFRRHKNAIKRPNNNFTRYRGIGRKQN